MESLDYISLFCIGAAIVFLVLAIVSAFKKNGKVKTNLSFIGGLLILLVLNLTLSDEEYKKSAEDYGDYYDKNINEEAKTVGEELKNGDAVNFEGLRVRLNSVRLEKGGEYDEKENDRFLVFNITAENTSDKEIEVNSFSNLELHDSEGYRYESIYLSEGTKNDFYGKIMPNGKLRADVVFDVSDAEKYQLYYKHGDYGNEEVAIWDILSNDIEKEKE